MTTRYELLDRIGVGGMAEIFRGKAVAAGGFEKPVAIKRILPHLAQHARFVELLIAEAKVLSLLKHRNIVQIFDVGLGDDGKYFLVMEYVDGKDLGAVQRSLEARRRRIPFDLCLHIGAEICEALEHAHSARAPDGKPMSLVHRDVSPSNVLVSRAGEVKLTDFGIAKRAEQESTGTHSVRGKFAYISPEQARNEHVDPRSDVFSVGILIWELITNQRLFSGLDDMAALRAVRDAKVPRPTQADPRLPKEIDAILMAALGPTLDRRPTAGQFGAQLRSLRYSLDVTVGDPATEIAKILDAADEVARESVQIEAERGSFPPVPTARRGPDPWGGVENTEATVIRIATADAFSMRDKDGASISRARQVIDRFEEEETRLAALSGDQLKILREGRQGESSRDSVELERVADARPRRPTDEPTRANPPLRPEDRLGDEGSRSGFDESTRLIAPRDRRTPAPVRVEPAPTRQNPAGGGKSAVELVRDRERQKPVPVSPLELPRPPAPPPRAVTSIPPPRVAPAPAPMPPSHGSVPSLVQPHTQLGAMPGGVAPNQPMGPMMPLGLGPDPLRGRTAGRRLPRESQVLRRGAPSGEHRHEGEGKGDGTHGTIAVATCVPPIHVEIAGIYGRAAVPLAQC